MAFREMILRLASHAGLRWRLGSAARRTLIARDYTGDSIIARIVGLVHRLAAQPPVELTKRAPSCRL